MSCRPITSGRSAANARPCRSPPPARARRGSRATRRACARCGPTRRSRRCRRSLPPRSKKASSRIEALAKSGKSSKPSATHRGGLAEARDRPVRDRPGPPPRAARRERRRPPLGALDAVDEPGAGPPLVEHAQVAEGVVPGHARRFELLPAGADRLGRGVGLERIEPALLADLDRLAAAARGSPRCGRCRPRGRWRTRSRRPRSAPRCRARGARCPGRATPSRRPRR